MSTHTSQYPAAPRQPFRNTSRDSLSFWISPYASPVHQVLHRKLCFVARPIPAVRHFSDIRAVIQPYRAHFRALIKYRNILKRLKSARRPDVGPLVRRPVSIWALLAGIAPRGRGVSIDACSTLSNRMDLNSLTLAQDDGTALVF